ncbi:MAG: 5-oxoprolinase subunit PxpB [Chloroflexota bacterium]|nr:5-oxoprolinase subunit PxpB [Chloroflexota bacterium]
MTSDPASMPLTIRPLAESGLLVEFADVIEPAIVERVMALSAAIAATRPAGLYDIVPSYRTILLAFDPVHTDGDTLAHLVRRLAVDAAVSAAPAARAVTIPVVYDGELGPDLADVATHTGLSPAAVCERHLAASYRVACMGFAPGFGFLVGLPPELATPRRQTPRTRVPAGSVAIGGAQTGVYPADLPGGWNIIGRTPVTLFDPRRDDPFLLQPGDAVRFQAIAAADFEAMAGHGASSTPVEAET